jgi:hypothetical protein
MRKGTWPVSRPDIHTLRPARVSSIAISDPEFPAPAISTPPSRSWAGLR